MDTTLGRQGNLTVLVFEVEGHRYEGILNVRGRIAAALDHALAQAQNGELSA